MPPPSQSLNGRVSINADDRAVLCWTAQGTPLDRWVQATPSAHRPVECTGVSGFRLSNGLIVEERAEEDLLGLFRQIYVVIVAPDSAGRASNGSD